MAYSTSNEARLEKPIRTGVMDMGQEVLVYAVKELTPYDSLQEFAAGKSMTALKKYSFNTDQIKAINDGKLIYNQLDITNLFKLAWDVCNISESDKKTDGTLGYYICKIKDERNNYSHENVKLTRDIVVTKLEELKQLYRSTIMKVGEQRCAQGCKMSTYEHYADTVAKRLDDLHPETRLEDISKQMADQAKKMADLTKQNADLAKQNARLSSKVENNPLNKTHRTGQVASSPPNYNQGNPSPYTTLTRDAVNSIQQPITGVPLLRCSLSNTSKGDTVGGLTPYQARKAADLKQAVSTGDQNAMVEALIDGAKASVILPEYSGYRDVSLIQVAAIEGHSYLIAKLYKSGANRNHWTYSGLNATHIAARFGHGQVIKELKGVGMNINIKSSRGLNALQVATMHGHAHVVAELVTMGVNVKDTTPNSFNALHIAAQHGQTNMLKVLVDQGINVYSTTDRSFNALHIAAQKGHSLVIRELVTNLSMNVNSSTDNSFNALHIAAQSGQPQVMDELVTNLGININSDTRNGQKAIHIAAREGHPQVLSKLKTLGMDVNTATSSGWTAVHFAVQSGKHRCVEMLGKLDACLDTPNNMKITPLVLAVKEDQVECMEALVLGGATVSVTDLKDEVSCAARYGKLPTLRFLIENGLDPNATDRDGKTPMEWAKEKGHQYIINWLSKRSQKPSN